MLSQFWGVARNFEIVHDRLGPGRWNWGIKINMVLNYHSFNAFVLIFHIWHPIPVNMYMAQVLLCVSLTPTHKPTKCLRNGGHFVLVKISYLGLCTDQFHIIQGCFMPLGDHQANSTVWSNQPKIMNKYNKWIYIDGSNTNNQTKYDKTTWIILEYTVNWQDMD